MPNNQCIFNLQSNLNSLQNISPLQFSYSPSAIPLAFPYKLKNPALGMLQDYFKPSNLHCQGQTFLDLDNHDNLYVVGSDDVLTHTNLITGETTNFDCNPDNEESYTSLAVHPEEVGTLALGATNKVEIVKERKMDNPVVLYNPTGAVYSVAFSHTGSLLAIASDEFFPIIYNFKKQRAVKCRPGHSNKVLSVVFSPDDKFLCSTSADGYLKIYSFDSLLDPSLISNYLISTPIDPIGEQRLQPSFNPKGNIIASPGKPQLQTFEYQDTGFKAALQPKIKHSKDITICYWQNNQILVTGGLDRMIYLWNMVKLEKITEVAELSLTKMKRYNNKFYGVNNSGGLFQWIRLDLLVPKVQEVPQIQQKQPQPQALEQPQTKQQPQSKALPTQPQPRSKKPPLPPKRLTDRLITCLPQYNITTCCQMQGTARFLFYNTIGCVIQRRISQDYIVQVEYHDKSFLTPKNITLENKQIKSVALWKQQFVYCTSNEFGFVGETSWSYEMEEEVLDVAMGAGWVASLGDQQVTVYDFVGNVRRRIEADRQYVAVRGYEDIMVLVYHDLMPFQGSQCLRMRMFKVEGVMLEAEEMFVPLSRGSILQSFGISTRGLIYAKDSIGKLRVYLYDRKEWVMVQPKLKSTEENYWIIDIGASQITAFILPEGQTEPTVLPRALPRQIQISVPVISANQNYPEYGKVLWRIYSLSHEKYRNREWFKYKFSRSKSNPYYSLSSNILTDGQIQMEQQKIQEQIRNIIRKMVDAGDTKKAMYLAKSFLKSTKVLEIFEEQPGCALLAASLKSYFNQKAIEQNYLQEKRLKLSFIDPNIVRNFGVLSFNPKERTISERQPEKPLLKGTELTVKIEREFEQIERDV